MFSDRNVIVVVFETPEKNTKARKELSKELQFLFEPTFSLSVNVVAVI